MPAPPSSPRVRALATALRRAREACGDMSVRDAGKKLGISHGLISFWENGKRVPSVENVRELLIAYGVLGDEKERILDLARMANTNDQNWLPSTNGPGMNPALAGVLDCEATAVEITQWTPMVIPGLLQTPEYASAMPADVETRVARRTIITRDDEPVQYTALISQSALEEILGDAGTQVRQLDFLLEIGKRPNVTVQVVPTGQGWHPGFGGPFIIYRFADSPSIVHIEHYSSSAFLYEDSDVEAYMSASQAVRSKAMNPAASAEFIATVRKKMEMR